MHRFYLICAAAAAAIFAAVPAVAEGTLDANILVNPSFESGQAGWSGHGNTYPMAHWSPPGAQHGSTFFYAGSCDWAQIDQNLDLSSLGYDATRLATGGYGITYGGWQSCYPEAWPSAYDNGRITLNQLGSSGQLINSSNLGWQWPGHTWTHQSGVLRLAAGTTELQYVFEADRNDYWGGNNDAYLDSTYVKLHAYDIWTHGNITHTYTGDGTWVTDSDVKIADCGTGSVYVDGGVWNSKKSVSLARDAGSTGTVTLSNGSWISEGTVSMGGSGNGLVTVDGGSWTASNPVYLATSSGSVGEVTLARGSWNAHYVVVGSAASGAVNVSGGVWTTSGEIYLGLKSGSSGVVTLSGGSWNAGASPISIGGTASGVVNVSGGSWTTDGAVELGGMTSATGTVTVSRGTWTAKGPVSVGQIGTGNLSIGSAGQMDVVGGSLNVGGNGQLTLDGGTLNVTNGALASGNKLGFTGRGGTLNLAHSGWSTNSWSEFGSTGNASAYLTNGTTWTSAGSTILGRDASRSATVDISDSVWRAAGPVTVGQSGTAQVFVRGAAGRLDISGETLNVGRTGSIILDGGSLNVTDAWATIAGSLAFTENGGTVNLSRAFLIHPGSRLSLNGGTIRGTGEVYVGSAGVDLGPAAKPGTIEGDAAFAAPLSIYGDVSGSGSLTNVAVFGNVNVGSSPGFLALRDVTLGGGSSILMEIAGRDPAEYDRLILDNVSFGGAPIVISFAHSFFPLADDAFDLFDGGNLAACLAGASVIAPDGWLLDRDTGILATPEPASAVLLTAASLLLLRRRTVSRRQR